MARQIFCSNSSRSLGTGVAFGAVVLVIGGNCAAGSELYLARTEWGLPTDLENRS